MNYIYLLFISEIILLVLSFFFSKQDIMSPSVIMCIVFVISTAFTVLNTKNWNISYCFEAYFLIITGMITYIVIENIVKIIFKRKARKKIENNTIKEIIYIQKWKVYFFIIIDIITLFWMFIEMKRIVIQNGGNIKNIIASYKYLAGETTVLTIGTSMNTIVCQLEKLVEASSYVFIFVTINNLIIKKKLTGNVLLQFVPIFCYIYMNLLNGNRYAILKIVAYILICSYILWHRYNGWNKNISWRYIKIGLIVLLIGLPIFYNLTTVVGRIQTKTMFDYISLYCGGSIQHFNQYIQQPPKKNLYFGEESLVQLRTFLWKLKMVSTRHVVHLEFRVLRSGLKGNVYTFFRRLIQDFGIFGMYLGTIIISTFFSHAYFIKIKSNFKNTFFYNKEIIIYCYFFPWIAMSSIEQCSFSYISVTTLTTVILTVLCLKFICSNRVVFKFK